MEQSRYESIWKKMPDEGSANPSRPIESTVNFEIMPGKKTARRPGRKESKSAEA